MAKKDKTYKARDKVNHSQLINHMGNIVLGYCSGCQKISTNFECTVYQHPIDRCRIGCAFSPSASQNVLDLLKQKQAKQRTGQQKQKKKK